MNRRVRLLLAVLLSAVLVGAGSTAAWAVWTATGTTGSSATIGKMSAGLTGTDAMTTTFSSSTTSVTNPVTFTNSGSLAGTTSTTVSVVSGSSAALAAAVSVTAWPVASAAACTTSTAVGSGSVSGTWSNLPSLSTNLAAGASVVWCVRSTPTAAAPPSSTANVILSLAVVSGTWTSSVVQGGFYLNTSASSAVAAATCENFSGNYVRIGWSAGSRPADTWYGIVINGTRVGTVEQSPPGYTTLAPQQIPATVASSGTVTVTVRVLDASQQPTSDVVGSTSITLYTYNDGPAIRCGA